MNRKHVVETEIDTGVGKPRRLQERFLKGPIPLRLIARAAKLPGGCLGVYLAVHHRTALTKTPKVTLPKELLTQFGISRDSKARALKQLDKAGLVMLENQKGRAARVMLSDERDAVSSTTVGATVNDQWEVVEDDLPLYRLHRRSGRTLDVKWLGGAGGRCPSRRSETRE